MLFVVHVYEWFLHRNHPRKVEKSRACRKLLKEHFPDTCLSSNVFELLKDKPKKWDLKKLKLTKYFWCEQHKAEWLDY